MEDKVREDQVRQYVYNNYRSYKNKTLYRCIPYDRKLYPDYLICYQVKELGFNKKEVDKYVLFKHLTDGDNHPIGVIFNTLGSVNELVNYYEYQLYCKEINHSIKELNLKPMAKLLSVSVGGVDPIYMGIGPCVAIPKALKNANLNLNDIDQIELNEAFAAQSLAVIKSSELNPRIVNPNGGAIALGHPLGCTGAKLTIQLINDLKRNNKTTFMSCIKATLLAFC